MIELSLCLLGRSERTKLGCLKTNIQSSILELRSDTYTQTIFLLNEILNIARTEFK